MTGEDRAAVPDLGKKLGKSFLGKKGEAKPEAKPKPSQECTDLTDD